MNTKEKYDKHIMNTYGRTDLTIEEGCGGLVVDENGKEYIDLGSGIGTNSLGFCDSDWVEAVSKQAGIVQHTSNYYYNEPCGEFADRLCSITKYDKVFFGNSGAEANECAIKLARKYSFDKYGKDRGTIITLTGSFHGRTLATLAATGQESFHNYFFPFPLGFKHALVNDSADLKNKIDDSVCAIMFEYIQGEGGIIPLSEEFVETIFELAKGHDLVTISDEIQCGTGRTGEFLAGSCFGKFADVTTLAKGLGGGLPIGVCMAKGEFAEVLTKGTHGSTFGGNPVVCAGGLTVLEKVGDRKFLNSVKQKGEKIRTALKAMKKVKSITGSGLMIGVELDDVYASDVVNRCADNGLLVLTAKEKLRLLPPLNISDKNIDNAMKILEKILA
ncbi:MAG: acetylornithine/succinylornithine family transaminase [Eubacterium sp.]|jgi:acetylornithine/N-succinyldiaminopimelate aminotransferase|nr:acetylornithine/succinylornithine family transaminase [Eubacterium sp.]